MRQGCPVFLCAPGRARLPAPGMDWVYLGTDSRLKAGTERRLGRPPRPVGRLIEGQARRLRQPFLDLVEHLGEGQDPTRWWAGTLAWKDAGASDLFLLCVYQAAAHELARSGRDLALVVEDPWLLEQLRLSLATRMRSDGAPFLLPSILKSAALGAGRRLKWLWRLARSRAAYQRLGVQPGRPGPRTVALFSYASPRCLAKESWSDPFNPGLAEELAAAGFSVKRFVDPDATGLEEGIAARGVEPLLVHAGLGDLAACALQLPLSSPKGACLAELPVDLLLERERWHDFSRAGRCSFELFRRCAARFLDAGKWAAVVYPWENQPQERMLALEARRRAVRSVGVQHSTMPSLQLSFFSGQGEAAWAPLPDALVCMGPLCLRQLEEGGVPAQRLLVGGSRRFGAAAAVPAQGKDVLIVLPIDLAPSLKLLEALARAYPRGGEGFAFRVRAHPSQPLPEGAIAFPAVPDTGTMSEALAACSVVLFTGTTAGLEALRAGRVAVSYRPEGLLPIDPSDCLAAAALLSCGDEDLRETLERARRLPAPKPDALAQVFAPVAPKVWLDAVGAA